MSRNKIVMKLHVRVALIAVVLAIVLYSTWHDHKHALQKTADAKVQKQTERRKPILEHSPDKDNYKYKRQFDEANDVVFERYPLLDVHPSMFAIPDA
jgi:hypothetical protein